MGPLLTAGGRRVHREAGLLATRCAPAPRQLAGLLSGLRAAEQAVVLGDSLVRRLPHSPSLAARLLQHCLDAALPRGPDAQPAQAPVACAPSGQGLLLSPSEREHLSALLQRSQNCSVDAAEPAWTEWLLEVGSAGRLYVRAAAGALRLATAVTAQHD